MTINDDEVDIDRLVEELGRLRAGGSETPTQYRDRFKRTRALIAQERARIKEMKRQKL